ncbi:MAG: 50S ribosomal protein L29 [Microgenomates bacterium 39_7]|nr:MAG: 50S ribosomal protein L29 [Microgenomates bacterium 39_7]
MKSNDKKALHSKSLKQLQQQLSELQQELAKSKLALHANKLEDVAQINRLKKDVARVKTVITKKQNLEVNQISDKQEQESELTQ